MDRRPVAVLGRDRRPRPEGRRRRGSSRDRRGRTGHGRPATGAQAGRDPRPRGRLSRQAARRGGSDDLCRGGKADEGGPRRGCPRDVDVHVRGRRGAKARRGRRADGRVAGGRRQARVHAPPPDRRRGSDLAVQLPAQPRRAQDRARAGSGLRRRAEARVADAALGPASRRAGSTRRACRPAGSTSSPAPPRRSATCSSRTNA